MVGEKAVAAAKVVSGHETVIANKNALLSELSHCCVMLGSMLCRYVIYTYVHTYIYIYGKKIRQFSVSHHEDSIEKMNK